MGKKNWAWRPKKGDKAVLAPLKTKNTFSSKRNLPRPPIDLSFATYGQTVNLADHTKQFDQYIDRYARDLKSGDAGWGVSFGKWLEEVVGFEIIAPYTLRRIKTVGEETGRKL